MYWLYNRPLDATRKLDRREVRRPSPSSSRRTRWRSRPATPTARRPSSSRSPTRCRRRSSTPGTTATSPGNTALALGFVAAAAARRACTLFLGSYPITPASDILHELSQLQELRRRHLPGRGRDRRDRRGDRRRRSPARSASRRPAGPGMALKGEAIGLAIDGRAAAGDRQRPARRARPPACRPRPSRPTSCRRSSAATARRRSRSSRPRTPGDCFAMALEACRIALKYMTPVILLSDGYLANGAEPWRLPERSRTCPTIPVALPDRPRGLPALRARPGDAGPALGASRARPGSSTASAASRSRTAPATSATTREPRAHGAAARGEGRGGSPTDIPDAEPSADRDGRPAGRRLGSDLRRDHRARLGGPTGRGGAVGHVHLRHLNPLPAQPRRGPRPLPARPRARDQHGPARAGCCGPATSSTPVGLEQGPGPAVHAVARSRTKIDEILAERRSSRVDDERRLPSYDEEGLRDRPGGALVPRLRRLRDPHRGAAGASRRSASRGRSS